MQGHFANEEVDKESVKKKQMSFLKVDEIHKYKSESVKCVSEMRQIEKHQFPSLPQSSIFFISMSISILHINMRLAIRRVNEALNGELAIAPIIGFRPQNTSAIDAKPRIFMIFIIVGPVLLLLEICSLFSLLAQLGAHYVTIQY